MDFSLNGKVALITGASRGIGEAAAVGLARYGADVVLASRKLPDLEKVAQKVEALGRKAVPIAAHVAKAEEIKNLVDKTMEAFGRIDILVNNAATNPTMDQALTVDERAWDAIMNLNLKGLFFLSQAVARIMKEKGGGNIINVSSIAGISPDLLPIYSISKAGGHHGDKSHGPAMGPIQDPGQRHCPRIDENQIQRGAVEQPGYPEIGHGTNPAGEGGRARGDGGGHHFPGFRSRFLHNGPGDPHRRRKDDLASSGSRRACWKKGRRKAPPAFFPRGRRRAKSRGGRRWSSPQMESG